MDETHHKLLSRAQEIGQKLKVPQNLKRKQSEMQLPIHITDVPSASMAMKEVTSDIKVSITPKNSISEKSDTIIARENSQQPISKLPVKQIVYHKRKKVNETSIESSS